MGMRVGGGGGGAPANNVPSTADQLIELERLPIKRVEERRNKVAEEQKTFKELTKLVSELGTTLNTMRNRSDFYRLKMESSHPDILDGNVGNEALVGSYELEVRNLARTHKLLADSFPDKDETPVGFGYMSIELDDGTTFDVDIEPGSSTLKDVAEKINDLKAGARAVILNTKENLENPDEENFRLLVLSEKSGKEAKITIDPDTTYLDFKEQVTGRNLEVMFEDVPVFDEDNTLEALMPGLTLTAKKAEPGTKVTVKIDYDLDATMENIKKFVESYNKANEFIDKQFQVDPQTNKAGVLSQDNTLRTLRRALQGALQYSGNGPIGTLSEVGISTDPKSGALKLDEAKAKKALAENYKAVADFFVQSDKGSGLGSRLSDSVRGVQNTQSGVLASKDREYKRLFENFDDDIARKERLAAQRAEGIKRKFSAMESLVSGLNAQGQFLQAKMGSM